jgi:hypothetical protein
LRVEVSAATRHTVEDLLAKGGDGEGGDGEGEGQVRVRRASADGGFFGGRTDKTAGTVCPVPPVFFDAEGVRSGRSRAGKGRRARPVAAADDAGLCATRRFGSDRIETRVRRVARCLDARSAG